MGVAEKVIPLQTIKKYAKKNTSSIPWEASMSISETQLNAWANQGAIVTAQATHESIRYALKQYNWGNNKYDDYLQGSYRNHTNIYGGSDVDLVVELTSVFYNNLSDAQKRLLQLTSADYSWTSFRQDVINALINYYGAQYVDTTGSKSIKLLPSGGRLKADVVVAATYRKYADTKLVAEGITLWDQKNNQQIINYPKKHYDNGAVKNTNTNQWFKPTIRIFKNARERLYSGTPLLRDKFPSYFIECLLYNAPNSKFGNSYQDTFCNLVNWLQTELAANPQKFTCQNEMSSLFGTDAVQWNLDNAKLFVAELISLWND